LARDAIAHEEEAPGGKVRMTFRVLLAREQAEALAARAIREEKKLETLATEILEGAKGRPGTAGRLASWMGTRAGLWFGHSRGQG
jgi:hypothetical protein